MTNLPSPFLPGTNIQYAVNMFNEMLHLKKQGYSQRRIADKLLISQFAVWSYLNGKKTPIGATNVQ